MRACPRPRGRAALPVDEEDLISLRSLETWLWDRGVRRVLLESGPQLLSRVLDAGFADQIRVYTGDVNGGRGVSMADWLNRLRLEGRLDREVGPDAVLEGFVLP